MAKDCCAANFERVVFRDAAIVEFSKKFKCVRNLELSDELKKRWALDAKKPAILLFDAEGGLLHKVQECQNPKPYLRALSAAYKLNSTRMKLKDRYLALRKKARESIVKGKYDKALKTLESMLNRREVLAGSVLTMVQSDRQELEAIGRKLFAQANELREDQELIKAYDLFREVKKQFARLDTIGRDAARCAKQVKAELKDLGVSVR